MASNNATLDEPTLAATVERCIDEKGMGMMSLAAAKCTACAVPVHPGSVFEHEGKPYHVPCLVRSLQGQVDAITERYEALRPHVSDRSVLRGLCHFADVAVGEGQHDTCEDGRAAMEWLRQTAGWSPEP
jgi:hypothetical protein